MLELEHAREFQRSVKGCRDQFTHQRFAKLNDGVADGGNIWPPKQRGRLQARDFGADAWQLPVGDVSGKTDRGFAACGKTIEPSLGLVVVDDLVSLARLKPFDAEIVEMRELDSNTTEVAPYSGKNGFDLDVGHFRKSGV